MRVENVEVTFRIPIPIDKPDCNGNIYSAKAIEQSVSSIKNAPIVIRNSNGLDNVVGFINDGYINNGYLYTEGIMSYGGIRGEVEIENGIITSMKISSVGITN